MMNIDPSFQELEYLRLKMKKNTNVNLFYIRFKEIFKQLKVSYPKECALNLSKENFHLI
tara:strand:- start:3252 stop:3428 length:177 start_codon:yes stop_codon:yes gene_type:complete